MRISAISALLMLFSVGCVRTMQPVLNDDQVVAEKSLLGKWVPRDGKDTIEVQSTGEEMTYKVLYTDKDGKKGTFVGRVGKIGDLMVAELRPDDPTPDASDVYKAHLVPLYSFMIIHQTTPDLTFSTMSSDWLKKYLETHPDELQVTKADPSIITSLTADFQAFLLKHVKDEGAFNGESVLVRPEAAAKDAAATK